MSKIELIHESCAKQNADVVVNAANRHLAEGSGICGVIFDAAGNSELAAECAKHKTPLKDGEAVITSACTLGKASDQIRSVA